MIDEYFKPATEEEVVKISPAKVPAPKEDRSLKYSEYVDIGLEEIELKLKEPIESKDLAKSIDLVTEVEQTSDRVDPYPEFKALRALLKQVKLPSYAKLPLSEIEDDMFFVIKKVSVLPYIAALFFSTVTLNSIFG